MKSKIIKFVMVMVVCISAYNVYVCSSVTKDIEDLVLNDVETFASGEEGGMHGRPLLQSASGAYKCGNCTGTDCGAVC